MTPSPQNSQTPSSPLIVGLVVILLSAGCGPGDGQGLDADGNLPAQLNAGAPGGGPPGGNVPSNNPNATLAWVQTNVFGGVCMQCHTSSILAGNLDWTSPCANVGRQSGEISTLKEIESGDPDTSYVIWKVEGRASIVGVRMPAQNPALTAETIQNMRDWIADGVPGCP